MKEDPGPYGTAEVDTDPDRDFDPDEIKPRPSDAPGTHSPRQRSLTFGVGTGDDASASLVVRKSGLTYSPDRATIFRCELASGHRGTGPSAATADTGTRRGQADGVDRIRRGGWLGSDPTCPRLP